jgi:hypothetical protein
MMKPEPGAHDMMQTISDLPAPAVHQFGVIKEMLDAIETTTIAGQRYVMGKVVAFLHGEVGRAGRLVGPRRRAVLAWLDELAGQAERIVPDVRLFNGRAELLVGALTADED